MPFGNLIANTKEFGQKAGNLLQTAWDKFSPAGVQNRNVDKTNQANRELAEYQYSKDLEMWNRGNAYNNPIEQMKRLKDAGLNPNLIYGSGAAGASGTTAVTMPKYNAPTMSYNYVPPVDVPNVIGMYQDVQIKNAQIDNLKAQRQQIEKGTFLKDIQGQFLSDTAENRRTLTGLSKDQAIQKLSLSQGLQPYQLQAAEIGNRNLEANINKTMAQTKYTNEQTDWIASKAVMSLLSSGTGMLKGLMPKLGKGVTSGLNQKYLPTKTGPTHVSRKIRYVN
ncbi:MAG: DNA pilot protein [Microviridae sp.]|nr:MAG: DNA pilot protein [Microviridae sp.]